VKPKQRDSVITQIRLLARFHLARAGEDPDALRVAERLEVLAKRLDPAGDQEDRGGDRSLRERSTDTKRKRGPRRSKSRDGHRR
jgi:hypothetical protein